jgi:hypothetical protein
MAKTYTRVHSLERKFKRLKPRRSFPPWEWYCARSEIKTNTYEIDEESKTITTPRIRRIKAWYEHVMDDIYQDSLSYVREATERKVAELVTKEKECLAVFSRQIEFADGEPPLRNSLKNLQDCQRKIVEQLTELQQLTLNLRDLFAYGYRSYELQAGRYVELLSKRLRRGLRQPYAETGFLKILQIREAAQELELRIAEYEDLIDGEQQQSLQRSRQINQDDDAARNRIGLGARSQDNEGDQEA